VNADKMLEVVRQYRTLLLHIPPASGPFDKQPSPREAYAHLNGMLDSIESFVKEGTPEAWDKANRWLGFMQGVFWMNGTFTLDQMREHNRSTKEEKALDASGKKPKFRLDSDRLLYKCLERP
jgi:hypothetical protein